MNGKKMGTKITKEFLDRVLTVNTLKKYRNYETQQYFVQEHLDWAYKNLIGLSINQAKHLMNLKHNEYMKLGRKDNDFTLRNEFVKIMHCINYEMGHGYEKSRKVEYWHSPKRKRVGIITEIHDINFVVVNDTLMSVDLIVSEEPTFEVKDGEIAEQLSLEI